MTRTDTTAAAAPVAGPPALTGLHHIGITVTDLEYSVAWYCQMLGMVQWMEELFPGGRTAGLVRPGTSLYIGLDQHERSADEPFAPHRPGLDHLALATTTRAELDDWHAYLTARGVACSEVRDLDEPAPCALFTFTDPDGVALEIIHMDPEA